MYIFHVCKKPASQTALYTPQHRVLFKAMTAAMRALLPSSKILIPCRYSKTCASRATTVIDKLVATSPSTHVPHVNLTTSCAHSNTSSTQQLFSYMLKYYSRAKQPFDFLTVTRIWRNINHFCYAATKWSKTLQNFSYQKDRRIIVASSN